ncbi:hypothetical protein LT679_11050 [Mucilaginibacter roseus]|uniref:TonB C-terminal domain-containing protein n=1 Tax=Mucilaginibacter roseus TaxID=1528868 RepID=A0ABS8U4V2_9SPHI|nr:hypothetical protein [Mucilaginibacter roseus]MCD8741140.1 hypothetical protein [Mucilaginibacter roseus]
MKKLIITICAALFTLGAMAQQHLAFPFQGGKTVMTKFFKDSLQVSADIIKKKASGTAVFKFTADGEGNIKKIIVYYADDASLVQPIIDALRKSNKKWVIPDGEKMHDFILPFSISFLAPATAPDKIQKEFYDYYTNRKPIMSFDQVPLDMATLLPTVAVNYSLKQQPKGN